MYITGVENNRNYIVSCSTEQLFFFLENSFDCLVEKFQRALYQHYQAQNAASLYEPTEMKTFAEQNAPGLFNIILHSILQDDPRLSQEHRTLQEKRTVVLLHIIAYFR